MLKLPVRVHVISENGSLLDADISNEEIYELFQNANKVWKQAEIEWQIESIQDFEFTNHNDITDFLNNPVDLEEGRKLLVNGVPEKDLLKNGWNVYIVGSLGPSGGVFLREISVVIFPVNGKFGLHPQILAHELGHSLGLNHVRPDGKNLMQGKPPKGTDESLRDPTKANHLTKDQIEKARKQAAKGRAYNARRGK